MTSFSPRTPSPTGSATDTGADGAARLARLIGRARIVVAVERLVPALWPALGFVGLYLALALLGLLPVIGWTAQALLLAAAITATGLALEAGLARFAWPRWRDGARRLERDSGLAHRPISESRDQALGNDPFALALWRLHRASALAEKRLTLRPPIPDLAARDPKNLRYGVALLLALGLAMAGTHWRARLAGAFDSGAGSQTTLDAWIDPPPYTGMAPVYLAPGDTGVIAVPAGSTLNLRAHNGAHAPGLLLGGGWSGAPRFTGGNGEYSDTARIAADAHVRVRAAGHVIGDWRVHAIADQAPQIAFDGPPSATVHQATKVSLHARDDYGVTGARLVLRPHGRGGPPLSVDLALPAGKSVSQTSYLDLTAHPYSGLMVDAYLEARDGAGQTGRSRTVTFRLPARIFTDPLGRALIEQRQNLAAGGGAARKNAQIALDALAIAPDHFYADKPGLYMGLRAAYWALAREPADIPHAEDLLWQMAISLEQNGLLDAAAELRRLQAQITQALAMGAPQPVIDQLLERYRQTMQRYMQALANNPGAAPPPMQDGNAKTVSPQDIEALVKAIQQMSAAGNREQAAQMLAVLQNLLENLHMAQGGQGGGQGGQQNKALNDAIGKFSDLMGKERGLLDKTMRQRGGNGDPKDGGPAGLAAQQRALRQQLDDAMKSLDPKLGARLGPAGSAMDRAGQSLSRKNLDNAGNEENNALNALRQGAEALAKQAQGPGQQAGNDADPLGRANGGADNGVRIPGASDLARARAILQELRKRAGERGRPRQELDYYDRLLKQF